MVIHLSHFEFYHIKMGVGEGTNIKVELLALWGLFHFVHLFQEEKLHIMGDSQIIVEWVNYNCNLHVFSLEPWLKRFKRRFSIFKDFSYLQRIQSYCQYSL